MSLVATLKSIKEETNQEQLARYDPNRPVVVDGSLSEMVSQALNIVHSKKNPTTGEPLYGKPNPTGNPPPGAGNIPNILRADSPNTAAPVIPTLESMQQDDHEANNALVQVLSDAINAKDNDGTGFLQEDPLMIYAIPQDGMIPEEMNANVDMFHDSGAVNIEDFVFVFTDSVDPKANVQYRCVDVNQKLKDYEGRGARVFPDLESFIAALPELRRRK